MIINKVTYGFVTQVFDTVTQQWVSQAFTAGEEVDIEDEEGDPVANEVSDIIAGHYLPFEMVQPIYPANAKT